MSDRGGGSHLSLIHRNRSRIALLECKVEPLGVIKVKTKADFGTFVNGLATLITGFHYSMAANIDLGEDTLEGQFITLSGDLTLATVLRTNSSQPLIASSGPGVLQLLNIPMVNTGGPLLRADLGTDPGVGVLILQSVRFSGDPPIFPEPVTAIGSGTGVGTIGEVVSADRIVVTNAVFVGLTDGLKITGEVTQTSVVDSEFSSMAGATGCTFIETTDDAEVDIFTIDPNRFTTSNATDRCVKFSTVASYVSPVSVSGCSIRGPGTFVDAAGLQKSDTKFLAFNNQGPTSPLDSEFVGNATFLANTVETVIGAGNQGVLLPIGNGAPSHEVFDGDAFVERFTLLGATAQVQSFRYDGDRARTFKVEVHCQLNRAGGGNIFVGLGLAHDPISGGGPVIIARSVTETEVGNSASPGYTTMTLALEPGDKVLVRMSNNSGIANLIMNSADWSVERT